MLLIAPYFHKGGTRPPLTTIHIPDDLLIKIDQTVKENEISQKRFIIQASEQAFRNISGKWSEGFFETKLNEEDFKLLQEGVQEMKTAIIRGRTNR